MSNDYSRTRDEICALLPRLTTLQDIPHDDDGPVFREPWEAQAFAITLRLYQERLFTWPEWSETLGAEIKRAQDEGDPDAGETYYHHWLNALERIIAEKGLTDTATLEHYQEAWRRAAGRTPHGEPIELNEDDLES